MSAGAAPDRVWLVDGSGIVFRAFHALPTLATRRGLPTGAAYGFTSMLAKLLREEGVRHIAVVFDAPGRQTFRSEAYADYKATRSAMPAELTPQIPYIHRVVAALGIRLLEVPGVEADDVIGTLSTRAAADGTEVRIVTSDKDMMQLVGPRVTLLDTMHDRTSGIAEVRTRFGVEPAQVVDVMALMGDAVDNIPGVKGIGEKTAIRLIAHFGSIDELYRRIDEVEALDLRGAKRVRTILAEGEDDARRSRFLATIRCDVPIDVELGALVRGEGEQAELKSLATELEFTNLLKEFIGEAPPQLVTRRVESATMAELEQVLAAPGHVALAQADAPGGPAGELLPVLPRRSVAVAAAGDDRVLLAEQYPDGLADLLARRGRGCTLIVDDLKALLHSLALDTVVGDADQEADVCDVQLASYVLDPSRRAHSVDALATDRLQRTLTVRADGDLAARSADVATALLELGPMLLAELEASGLTKLYRELELPLARVLAVMEARGIAVDREVLAQAGRDFRVTADRLEAEIFAVAGGPFNLGSPAQLREVLFTRLNLPTKGVKRGKTGLSVDADVLNKLAESTPIAAKIVEHRALSKLMSTYVSGLGELIDPRTGRLRTSFNQTVAATGRLSSSEPNLQNIPVRSAEGRRIRSAFVAGPGMLLLSADYSQIELRVLAHLTADPVLLEAFRTGEDVHRRTAAEVFGVAPDAVTPEMRRQAKVINFGIIYGMGPQRLSRELGITLPEADDYIRRYFARYANVREFSERVIADGRRDGFVATLIGRRRYLPELNAREANLRQSAERMAWNSPIQGTAADIIKLAMLVVEREIEASGSGARMLLQVHDELLFEVPESELDDAGPLVRRCMESVVELAVPLLVELKKGPNWAALQ